jgi:hypothetical protein
MSFYPEYKKLYPLDPLLRFYNPINSIGARLFFVDLDRGRNKIEEEVELIQNESSSFQTLTLEGTLEGERTEEGKTYLDPTVTTSNRRLDGGGQNPPSRWLACDPHRPGSGAGSKGTAAHPFDYSAPTLGWTRAPAKGRTTAPPSSTAAMNGCCSSVDRLWLSREKKKGGAREEERGAGSTPALMGQRPLLLSPMLHAAR